MLALGLLATACQTQAPRVAPTIHSPIEPLPTARSLEPSRSDRAAAQLTEAALASQPGQTQRALGHLALADPRLLPLGQDLANATLDDPIAYRKATQKLLRRPGLDPLLKSRLQRTVNKDPLAAADQRIFDHRHTVFAHTFNAVTEPLGKSIFTGMTVAPYKLALSFAKWAMTLLEMDPLTLPERQARVLRKHFLDAHPDAPEAPRVREQVADAEEDFYETRHRHLMVAAKSAMNQGQPRLARIYAEQAHREVPDDRNSFQMTSRAKAKVAKQRSLRRSSVQFAATLPHEIAPDSDRLASIPIETGLQASLSTLAMQRPTVVRNVGESLLLPDTDLEASAKALREADEDGTLHDEADFIAAIGQHEAGHEESAWYNFNRLAHRDPRESNMARHAAALSADAWQNPYGSFLAEHSRQRQKSAFFFLFGETRIPRYKALPQSVGYLMAAPRMAQALATSPIRNLLALGNKKPNFEKGMAVSAYRYLERYPQGAHHRELVAWLYEYEQGQKNWTAALRLADFQPGFDPEERRELVEKAGEARLEAAGQMRRRDRRSSVLRDLARNFPDSNAGQQAGNLVRNEVEEATPQTIRMSREFLYENPAIAGPQGLGLRSTYLDGKLDNGELHPRGVVLLGGRVVEFNFVDVDGDEEAQPLRIQRPISAERLAQTVAIVEERSFHNARLDPEMAAKPDARRDLYFERARLGLTDQVDLRTGAQSTFTYESLRERYGMVRARESILPFDLVFQGSLGDFSLGAFPRWRAPKATPDAFLYR